MVPCYFRVEKIKFITFAAGPRRHQKTAIEDCSLGNQINSIALFVTEMLRPKTRDHTVHPKTKGATAVSCTPWPIQPPANGPVRTRQHNVFALIKMILIGTEIN